MEKGEVMQRTRRNLPPGKWIKYTHNPFNFNVDDDTRISCDKDGRITIQQDRKDADGYDEIEIPASAIFKTADMLTMTRSSEVVDKIPRQKKVTNGNGAEE